MDAYELQETVDRWTMAAVSTGRVPTLSAIAGAQGPVIYDANGKRYLDFRSGCASVLGHNHPRYIEAVSRRLHAVGDAAFLDKDTLRLHQRLGEILTPPLQKSLLLPHGDAAIQAAAGMARTVTGGSDVLTVSSNHDGDVFFGRLAPMGGMWETVGAAAIPPQDSGHRACDRPWDCDCNMQRGDYACPRTGLERALRDCDRRPAALVLGPLVDGALSMAPPGYARALRRLCHQYGMLLIMDESTTGFGKTGRMWGHQQEDIVPDIMIVSACFGSGLSIDAVCAPPDIAEQVAARDGFAMFEPWRDPVACAAAATGIDIVEEENLVARAAAIGERLRLRLAAMAAEIPLIRAVRGRGAMYVVELADDIGARMPGNAAARAAILACRDKGLLLRTPARHSQAPMVHVSPPMVCTEAEIDEGLDILGHVLRDMAMASTPARAPQLAGHAR